MWGPLSGAGAPRSVCRLLSVAPSSCIQQLWIHKPTQRPARECSPHGCQEGLQAEGTGRLSVSPKVRSRQNRTRKQLRRILRDGRGRPGARKELGGSGKDGLPLEGGLRRGPERRASAGRPRAARLLVLVEQGHAREGAGARLALVLLHVRVRLQVSTQVGAVGEGAAAVGAGEGLLAWGQKDSR